MEHMKLEQVPAKAATQALVLDKTTCDICQEEIVEPGGWDLEDINVSARIGTQYPEGGDGKSCQIDLCTSCFKGRLIPFIESFSGVITWEKWSN